MFLYLLSTIIRAFEMCGSTNPLATVLMAFYNNEAFIELAIESILKQTFTDFEFLIIDDASTDGSCAIVDLASERDSRIRVLRNTKNLGLGKCLEMGTERALGKYLVRMDADDISFSTRLETQLEYLESNQDIDIIGSTAIEIDSTGKVGMLRLMPASNKQIAENIWACPLIHPTVAFRRRRVIEAGNYDGNLRRRQDYELWFRCVDYGLRFANIQEPLIYYRFDSNTHRKQSINLAIEQAKIGLRGCNVLGLPLWQRVAVTMPVWRAMLPVPLQHFVYRSLATLDPRNRKLH